jgi:two-component system, NtrC family, sensor kinase
MHIPGVLRPLHHSPIQRRLRIVTMTTCAVALAVACAALFAFQLVIFRQQFQRDLAATAAMIGDNSAAVLAANDAEGAADILAALKAKPHITGAALVLADGTALGQGGDALLPSGQVVPPQPGLRTLGETVIYTHPVTLDEQRLGTLVLHADYRSEFVELLQLYVVILLVVLGVSVLVAASLAARLERVILAPIRELAEVTRRIAEESDYTVRAQKGVDDEIGTFTDSFNAMLDRVEHRDRALRCEIAERSRAEAELQRVHRELLDASRRAGMAEVATGVLHNVGNVLNSVNVSAMLLAEKLTHSRAGNLSKAAALLREQNAQLSTFLADDPKGRVLPGYLAEASRLVEREREEALSEIDRLARNVEHIKQIVAAQQNYARNASLIEPLALAPLLDDALRMAGCAEHDPTVVRDYGLVPLAAADKHRLLQILVNLIRNARHAILEGAPPEPRLELRLGLGADGMVEIRIRDNGSGIAAENLTRIFSHGFTTRKDGHGFGLHSAALAAQEMGGRISVESDGPGAGATFILVLPIAETAPPPLPGPEAAPVREG